MKTLFTMLLVSGVLVGCATQPKPELSSMDYWQLEKRFIQIHVCNNSGWIPSETAATGLRYFGYRINKSTWDSARFDREATALRNDGFQVTQQDCKQLALAINTEDQQVKAAQYTTDSTPDIMGTTSRSTNTYCNKLGTQTFCRTY